MGWGLGFVLGFGYGGCGRGEAHVSEVEHGADDAHDLEGRGEVDAAGRVRVRVRVRGRARVGVGVGVGVRLEGR